MKHTKALFTLIVMLLSLAHVQAQDKHKDKPHVSFKDSLDGAFDLSDYLIYANGFIVVPVPMTQPALGGIGGAIVPVFLKKRPPYLDEKTGKTRMVRPDITGAIGMYTANDSWFAGGFRSGTLAKQAITYRIMGGYGSINMSFYETLPGIGEKEYEFNFNTLPIYLQALKQFRNEKWSLGPQYLFLKADVSLPGADLPDFVKKDEVQSITSQLGLAFQYDSRDNIFTPDEGLRLQTDFFCSDNIFGSDYDAWRVNYSFIGYVPITKKLVGGLRIEGSSTFGDTPFFLKPSVNLRGIANGRYQGQSISQTEAEFRWDAYRRWSAMFFGGVGVAFDKLDEIPDQQFRPTYGTGFRYLIARKFKLRMGFDVAKGPDSWAYYIIFGSNWMR